jgi:tRNA A-37 threonylcarbamoyl transferase component Bud32
MLGGGWLLTLSRTDRWRFWQSYLAARPEAKGFFPTNAAEQVVERMWRHARAIAAMRDKRALKSNRDFQRLKTDRARVHAVTEIASDDLRVLSNDPATLLRSHRHQPVKISHASLLVEASLAVGKLSIPTAYKRSRTNSWWKRLLSPLRRSRAIATWQTGHALLARGIATARPLVAIQPRPAFGNESYLATEWLQGTLNLHLYMWQLADSEPDQRHRRACQAAESLGRLLGRMHAWHVSHRDLKGCNLVVREHGGQTQSYLIDLEGVRFTGGLSDARRSRDLARLAASMEAHSWLSRSIRLRFLRAYLRELRNGSLPWKPLWHRVARDTIGIINEFHRRGRPVA